MASRWIDAVRRNHALEHATVAMLIGRHGALRVAGRASGDGFFLICHRSPEEVRTAADEALRRLRSGEAALAVSPYCGTNIAVTALLSTGIAAAALSSGPRSQRLPQAVVASMVAVVLAQPLGRMLQRVVTTRPDLGNVEVTGVQRIVGPLMKVRTRSVPATRDTATDPER